jgi:hypothetical protein
MVSQDSLLVTFSRIDVEAVKVWVTALRENVNA